MSIILDSATAGVEFNILLIGQTSKRQKSTFINALANYHKFASLADAVEGELVELIPTRFELEDQNNGRKTLFHSGGDDNEIHAEYGSPKVIKYTSTQNVRVYPFDCNGKQIRLIDTPGWKWTNLNGLDNNKYQNLISQCLTKFKKLHGILLVKLGDQLSSGELDLLQIISKNACKNVVICLTKVLTYTFRKDKELAKFNSHIQKCIKITPNHGETVLTIDNEAYQFLIAHQQGNIFEDDQIESYSASWTQAAGQIQSMLNYVTSRVPCDWQDTVELMQSIEIRNLCFKVIKHFYFKEANQSSEIDEIVKLIEQNTAECEIIEDTCIQLFGLVVYSSVVSFDSFNFLIQRYNNNSKLDNFFQKLSNVFQNRQSFEQKFNKLSITSDLSDLSSKLQSLPNSGSYFIKEINGILKTPNIDQVQEIAITKNDNSFEIMKNVSDKVSETNNEQNVNSQTPEFIKKEIELKKYETNIKSFVQLQQILTVVTENKLILVEIQNTNTTPTSNQFDLTNATLENVVFACDTTNTNIGDIILKSSHSCDIKQEDIDFMVENIDRLIKSNFDNLIPVIKNHPEMQAVISNEMKKRAETPPKNMENEQQNSNIPLNASTHQQEYLSGFTAFNDQSFQNGLNKKLDFLVESMIQMRKDVSNIRKRVSKSETNMKM